MRVITRDFAHVNKNNGDSEHQYQNVADEMENNLLHQGRSGV